MRLIVIESDKAVVSVIESKSTSFWARLKHLFGWPLYLYFSKKDVETIRDVMEIALYANSEEIVEENEFGSAENHVAPPPHQGGHEENRFS